MISPVLIEKFRSKNLTVVLELHFVMSMGYVNTGHPVFYYLHGTGPSYCRPDVPHTVDSRFYCLFLLRALVRRS